MGAWFTLEPPSRTFPSSGMRAPPAIATTSGRAIPDVEVLVVDPSGAPVPVGEAGEIWVRSAQIMAGYWGKPEATEPLRLHPRNSLPRSGVTLHSLEIHHPSGDKLQTACEAIGLQGTGSGISFGTGPARISASLQTPKGLVQLHSLGI